VAEKEFHGIVMTLKVGVKVRYHKTDEFPQITLQHAHNTKSQTTKRTMEHKIRLMYVMIKLRLHTIPTVNLLWKKLVKDMEEMRSLTCHSLDFTIIRHIYDYRPPLWSSGQSFWLQIQRFQVRFLALPDFLRSRVSGRGSTHPCEDN
jgi:hypothetical protein